MMRRALTTTAASLGISLILGMTGASGTAPCRDRLKQPFSSTSIWNTGVGSSAVYLAANIYPISPAPAPPADWCTALRPVPSQRQGCPGWNSSWGIADCGHAGCCYDPHPNPDPHGYAWCYANTSKSETGTLPGVFYVDTDYFIPTTTSDPLTPFVNQGWWGSNAVCGRNHCCKIPTSKVIGTLPFPSTTPSPPPLYLHLDNTVATGPAMGIKDTTPVYLLDHRAGMFQKWDGMHMVLS